MSFRLYCYLLCSFLPVATINISYAFSVTAGFNMCIYIYTCIYIYICMYALNLVLNVGFKQLQSSYTDWLRSGGG